MQDGVSATRQRLLVVQQNGSGEAKIAGLRKYGGDLFEIEVWNVDVLLPPFLEDGRDYLPKDFSCDLVLDFLCHYDLSTDLAAICAKKEIPVVASGKKLTGKGISTPPT